MSVAYGSTSITSLVDIESSRWYYMLATSKPSKPTVKADPPSGWSKTEPTYTEGSTNNLYVVNLIVYGDGTFEYSDVSLSSSYEAAKLAYNKALTTQNNLDNLEIGGRNLAQLKYCGRYSSSITYPGDYKNMTVNDYTFSVTANPSDIVGFRALNFVSGDTLTISGETNVSSNLKTYYQFYNNNTKVGSQANKTLTATNNKFSFQIVMTSGANRLDIGIGQYPYSSAYYIKNVKIEKGNVVTAFSPAPEDANEYADNAIFNLKIGGRNLLLNSSMRKNLDKWDGGANWNFTVEDGYECIHTSGALQSTRSFIQDILPKIDVENLNTTYVISADVKLVDYTKGTTNPMCEFYFGGNRLSNNAWLGATYIYDDRYFSNYNNAGWVKIFSIIRFSDIPKAMAFGVYFRDGTGDLYVKNIKLEKGGKATDWTPAPEDTDNAITNIEIGGRNLLLNTLNLSNHYTTVSNSGGTWTFTENGNVATLTATTKGWPAIHLSGTASVPYATNMELLGKSTIITSVEIKFSSDSVGAVYITPIIYNSGRNRIWFPATSSDVMWTTLPTTWTKFTTGALSADYTTWGAHDASTDQNIAGFGALIFWNGTGTISIRNPKMEVGNKATGWYPAPEDVSTYTDTAIYNLEIGGTNLLRNTKTFIDWNKSNNISISTDSEGYAVADYSSVTTPAWNSIYNAGTTTILNYSTIRNKTVTLSFWVKIDDISVGIYNAMNVVFSLCTADSTSRMKYSNNVVLDKVANTTEWQKVVATVDVTDSYFPNGSGTINPDTDRMYIMFYNHSTSASHIKKVKLEFGNKATDWSFAPEDTIDYVDTSINNIRIGGENLAHNQLSYMIPDAYNCARINLIENLIAGEEYTLQIWGTVSRSDMSTQYFNVHWGGGSLQLGVLSEIELNRWALTFVAPITTVTQQYNAFINIYNGSGNGASGTVFNANIEKWKLERGNKPTEWSDTLTTSSGGRNIARGTSQIIKGSGSWSTGTYRDSEAGTVYNVDINDSPVPNVNKGARIVCATAGTQAGFCQDGAPLRAETVVMSVWVKGVEGDSFKIQPFWKSNIYGLTKTTATLDGTWQKITCTGVPTETYSSISIIYCYLIAKSDGNSCLVCAPQLEYGSVATDYSIAPEDVDAAFAPELIVGTHGTTATSTWTGTSTKLTSITSGTRIQFKLTSDGKSPGNTLNLTLANGTTTGAKNIYFVGTTTLQTQYGANSIIDLIYDGSAWRVLNPYTNSNTVGVYGGVVKAGSNGVKNYSLVMKDTDTTWVSLTTTAGTGASKERYTGGLYPDRVMYMGSNAAYTSGQNTGTCYDAIAINLNYSTNSNSTLTIGNPVYLVGEIHSDGLFYLDATWWTQTQPTTADGKTYIYLGLAYSASNIYLVSDNTVMRYYDGEFLPEKEIGIREAQSTADSAQTTANTANNKASAKYGTCSTAAGTAAKVVSCSNFTLFAGAEITIKFSTANTAAAPTLNVNSTGAKNIDIASAHASSANQFLWAANAEITFTYTGSVWIPVGHPCTYYGACTIAAGTAAKTAAINQAVICKGTVVNIQMTNANTVATPSLNITSTGAKNIYAGGATLAANSPYNWTAGATVQFTFDGQYWRMGESSALSKANTAMTAANGKNKVYHCAYADRPTSGLTTNDILFDTADGYKMYRYNGSSWAAEQFGTGAIATGAIKANQIDANAVTTAKIDTGAVTADKITVNDAFANKIFAQDITATGTITGASLVGAELTGEQINISSEENNTISNNTYKSVTSITNNRYVDTSSVISQTMLTEKISKNNSTNSFAESSLSLGTDAIDFGTFVKYQSSIELQTSLNGSSLCGLSIIGANMSITGDSITVSSVGSLAISGDIPLDSNNSYTSFTGNVVSDSTVVVVEKLGWCQVFGALKPTSAGTSWVAILDDSKVPPPQHGFNIYQEAMYWSSSYTQPLRIRVGASGGLYICRGYVGGSYGFSITYPIE